MSKRTLYLHLGLLRRDLKDHRYGCHVCRPPLSKVRFSKDETPLRICFHSCLRAFQKRDRRKTCWSLRFCNHKTSSLVNSTSLIYASQVFPKSPYLELMSVSASKFSVVWNDSGDLSASARYKKELDTTDVLCLPVQELKNVHTGKPCLFVEGSNFIFQERCLSLLCSSIVARLLVAAMSSVLVLSAARPAGVFRHCLIVRVRRGGYI